MKVKYSDPCFNFDVEASFQTIQTYMLMWPCVVHGTLLIRIPEQTNQPLMSYSYKIKDTTLVHNHIKLGSKLLTVQKNMNSHSSPCDLDLDLQKSNPSLLQAIPASDNINKTWSVLDLDKNCIPLEKKNLFNFEKQNREKKPNRMHSWDLNQKP